MSREGFLNRVRQQWPAEADRIEQALFDPIEDVIENFKSVSDWVGQCFNRPKSCGVRMCAVNEAIDGFGVEAIFADGSAWPDMEYVNLGDTYTTTIIHDHTRGKYLVGCWGTWVEEQEKEGYHYA